MSSTPSSQHYYHKAWYQCPDGPMVLGEGPIYRASDSTLHWVDCLASPSKLYIIGVDPETGDALGDARVLTLEDSVSVLFFRKNRPGSYIAAYSRGICFLDECTGQMQVVKEIIPSEQRDEFRFNDGGIDALGRFWLAEIDKRAMAFGAKRLPTSYGRPRGKLWRYDPDGSLHLMLDGGLVCGNGVAWSPDNKTMYLNDSVGMKMYAFDFDVETGGLSNQRVLVDSTQLEGEPDGMIVDEDGNLWNAVYGTNCVKIYSPEGRHLRDVRLNAKNVTCPTWGGKDHKILFVTSGREETNESMSSDEGGLMFRVMVSDVKGSGKREFAG